MSVPRATGHFEGVNFAGFWNEHSISMRDYVEPAPSDELIAEVEAELGYRLPDSYVELARIRNGGLAGRSCHPMDDPTWADDYLEISYIYAIGRTATYALCGPVGSSFMREEWGYPDIGIGIANTPSAGHEQIMLDYRACGPQGEPRVVHVDQEADYKITAVAADFATFVGGLVSEDEYDDSAATFEADLVKVRGGVMSPILRDALTAADLADGEALIRALAERIVQAKGYFALHADPDSWLMYDTLFWLHSQLRTATSFEDFMNRAEGQVDYRRPCYELMIAMGFAADPYEFCTGGYAPGFLRDWWDHQTAGGAIVAVDGGHRFTAEHMTQLVRALRTVGQ